MHKDKCQKRPVEMQKRPSIGENAQGSWQSKSVYTRSLLLLIRAHLPAPEGLGNLWGSAIIVLEQMSPDESKRGLI
jgi:hypothetical protein